MKATRQYAGSKSRTCFRDFFKPYMGTLKSVCLQALSNLLRTALYASLYQEYSTEDEIFKSQVIPFLPNSYVPWRDIFRKAKMSAIGNVSLVDCQYCSLSPCIQV